MPPPFTTPHTDVAVSRKCALKRTFLPLNLEDRRFKSVGASRILAKHALTGAQLSKLSLWTGPRRGKRGLRQHFIGN